MQEFEPRAASAPSDEHAAEQPPSCDSTVDHAGDTVWTAFELYRAAVHFDDNHEPPTYTPWDYFARQPAAYVSLQQAVAHTSQLAATFPELQSIAHNAFTQYMRFMIDTFPPHAITPDVLIAAAKLVVRS